ARDVPTLVAERGEVVGLVHVQPDVSLLSFRRGGFAVARDFAPLPAARRPGRGLRRQSRQNRLDDREPAGKGAGRPLPPAEARLRRGLALVHGGRARNAPAARQGREFAGSIPGPAGAGRDYVLPVVLPDETGPARRGAGEAGAIPQRLPRARRGFQGVGGRPEYAGPARRSAAQARRRAEPPAPVRLAVARPVRGRGVPQPGRLRGRRNVLPPIAGGRR